MPFPIRCFVTNRVRLSVLNEMATQISISIEDGSTFDPLIVLEKYSKAIQSAGFEIISRRMEVNGIILEDFDDFVNLIHHGEYWQSTYHDRENGFFTFSYSVFGLSCTAYLRQDYGEPPIVALFDRMVGFLQDVELDIVFGYVANTVLEDSFLRSRKIPYYFVANYSKFFKVFATRNVISEHYNWVDFLRIPAFHKFVADDWIEFQVYERLADVEADHQLAHIRRIACFLEKYNLTAHDGLLKRPDLYDGGDKRASCAECNYE